MRNLNHWQIVLFWYAMLTSLGIIFMLAYFLDGIKPKELIEYVHGSQTTRKVKA